MFVFYSVFLVVLFSDPLIIFDNYNDIVGVYHKQCLHTTVFPPFSTNDEVPHTSEEMASKWFQDDNICPVT